MGEIYGYIFDAIYSIIGYGGGYQQGDMNLEDLVFELGSNNTTFHFNEWICHTLTIIVICLIVFMFIKIAIWFFKLGANLFKW